MKIKFAMDYEYESNDIGAKLLWFQKSKTIERFVNFHT